ncbi:unnamed protein product, partial [Pylaiella littoralis]
MEIIDFIPFSEPETEGFSYYLQIVHYEGQTFDTETSFLFSNSGGEHGFTGSSDGSMYGHSCASKCITVAAMDWEDGTGANGTFADPETSSVAPYSSRGPCIVNNETRRQPTTCATDHIMTSTVKSAVTDLFQPFVGTSASAPVAAAIATIIRAACYPKMVGYDQMMEMLTNYDYTIDYTSDGTAETWGAEAGYGIISARKMLAWVEANCNACSGMERNQYGICSNGLAGIEATNSDGITACCPRGCNQCGGSNCDTSGLLAGY